MPNGIESTWTCHVIFKRCVAQTASYKKPIDVMFVLQDIEIDTHTGIRSTGLEPYTCRFIGFISLSDTYFNDGIVPILDVDTLTIAKTSVSHFESVDCQPVFFHTITGATTTGRIVNRIEINNPNVDYDGSKENFHLYISRH